VAAVAAHFNLAPNSFILKTSTTVLSQENLMFIFEQVKKKEEEERAKGRNGTMALYLYVEKV
jgi:hypothetical protein